MKYIFLLGIFMTTTLYPETRSFIGYAYDLTTNKLLYTENHEEYFINNKHIKTKLIYKNEKNEVIAEKNSNYEKNSQIPLFQLKDFRNGYEEGSIYENNGFKIYYIENQHKKISNFFKFDKTIALDSGFHKFIQNHFEDLLNNQIIKVNFAVPSRLTLIPFRVYKQKTLKINNEEAIRFVFEVDNVLFRLLVKPIYVDYSIKTKDLLQYIGISNLYDENSKAYNVKIIFKYN
jgi:hypothetical protein